MREPMNIANAIVMIACMYFLISGEFGFWAKAGIFLILLFSIATWGHWHVTKDHKKLLQRQIEESEARIKNLNSNTAFMVAQAGLTMRGIRR